MITLWVGAAIGAGMSIAGSIAGGVAAKKQAGAAQKELEKQRQKNEEWYNRRYNENATQRGDAQRMLTKTEEMIRQRNKAAQGAQAVMGGTSESVAAAKAANNKAISDTASNITASADARKDAIETTYMQNEANFSQQQQQIHNNRSQAIAGAVQGLAKTGAAIADSDFDINLGGIGKKETDETDETDEKTGGE